MERIKKFIYEQLMAQKISKQDAKLMLMEIQESMDEAADDQIAIIGMSCRFPGANGPEEYWANMQNEVRFIGPFPKNRRKDTDPFLVAEGATGNLEDMYINGGYLEEVDLFDPAFFRISPREAMLMDPWQRVYLEAAWKAIEDAGYGEGKIYGTRTGVYVGKDHTVQSMYRQMIPEFDPLVVTGSWAGILASRIAYIFDFKGPSLVVDTACSSGLVAFHLACQALKNKECDLALAGGIQIVSAPTKGGDLTMVESSNSMVRTFDKGANGTVWGEGVASFLLKPLKKALADRDPIHAVIKGSAINNDGLSNGLTAPNVEAQEQVILRAWKEAKIDPETISYIEAHGTATMLGDPIEIKGLTNAFRKYTDRKQFCAIGSVKPSIGHLVAASGLAALIKVILAMKNEKLPASLNFDEPNPYIDFCDSPLYVNSCYRKWTRGATPLRAGVSAFGFSGTNCHVIVEEAPAITRERQAGAERQLLALSGRSEYVLRELVQSYLTFLETANDLELADICYTANTGKGHYSHRLIFSVDSIADLQAKLRQVQGSSLDELQVEGVWYGVHKVVTNVKKGKEAGQITEEERRQLSKEAHARVQEFLQATADRKQDFFPAISQLYIQGADLQWEDVYKGQERWRVRVPKHPFERVRFWVEPKLPGKKEKRRESYSHPFLDHVISHETYVTDFEVDRHWVLSEHKLLGHFLLPGTTHLELASAVGKRFYPDQPIEMRNVMFIMPFAVGEGEIRQAETIANQERDHLDFSIVSKSETFETIRHAEGKIYPLGDTPQPQYNIEELKKRCNLREEIIEKANLPKGGFEFGPRWDSLRKIYVGENDLMVEMEFPEEFKDELAHYVIHPALLDASVNLATSHLWRGMMLPFSYRSLKIFAPLPQKYYSFVSRNDKTVTKTMETLSYNITLIDPVGKVLVEIKEYTLKKVHDTEMKVLQRENTFYGVHWVEEAITASGTTTEGHTLVLTDGSTRSQAMIAGLASETNRVIQVTPGSSYQKLGEDQYIIRQTEADYLQLIQELKNAGLSRIIHLTSMAQWGQINDLTDLTTRIRNGLYSLFYLTRAIMKQKLKDNLELIVIADDINEVTGNEEELHPEHASMAGMVKVIGQEVPNLSCRLIDIEATTPVTQILAEVRSERKAWQVAYRDGIRYVEEFGRIDTAEEVAEEWNIREGGVYLITGGTGGLGLEMGKHLAGKNRVHLALINRSSFPGRDQWEAILTSNEERLAKKIKAIQEMEATGSTVMCYSADTADYDQMKAVLDDLRARYGQINGIIHAAGLAGDGFIVNKEEAVFTAVLRPKIYGAWILDQLTTDDSLDFFVLFSSMIAHLGGPGQGDYAAANSYLNSFAAARAKRGKKTLAINWPGWKETGMAVDYGVNNDMSIFKSLTTAHALDAFDEIMTKGLNGVIPGALHLNMLMQMEKGLPFRLAEPIRILLQRQRTQSKKMVKEEESIILTKQLDEYSIAEMEEILVKIWADVLGLPTVSVDEDFFALGGHSLNAMTMAGRINKIFHVEMSVTEFFEHPTVKELATYILGAEESIYSSMEPLTGREYYPVSSAQKRLYALCQIEGISLTYNSPGMIPIPLELDRAFVEQAVRQLIQRHESLRTSFAVVDGEIVQKIHDEVAFDLYYAETEETELGTIARQFIREFDLQQPPLLRFGLIKTPRINYLIFDMHHIISDGASAILFTRELFLLLKGEPLPELRIQYKDFAAWQNQLFQSETIKEQEAFWLQQFADQIPVLNLPTDYPRGLNPGYAGDMVKFELSPELVEGLSQLAQKQGVTMFMLLLTAYSILLAKYSLQDDLVIGSPTAGRPHADLENIVGMFVNILPVRSKPAKDKTIGHFLAEVKETVLQAFEHQDYQLEMLIDQLGVQRDLTRNPLFDCTFVLQNHRLEDLLPEHELLNPFEFNTYRSKFDITLNAFETKGRILCSLEYKTGLFTRATIERMARNYIRVMEAMMATVETQIQDIQLDVEYEVIEDAPIDDVEFSF